MRDCGVSAFAHKKLREMLKTSILQAEYLRGLETKADFLIAGGTLLLTEVRRRPPGVQQRSPLTKKSPPGTTTSADMNADPELKPPILGLSGARLCQRVLNRNSVLDSIHCARELGQHAVPGSVGHPGLRAR